MRYEARCNEISTGRSSEHGFEDFWQEAVAAALDSIGLSGE